MNRQQQAMLVSIAYLILIIIGITSCIFIRIDYASDKNSEISFKVNDWSCFQTEKFSLYNIGRVVDMKNGKIAPGTNGEFDIVIDANDSKNILSYNIKIKEYGNKPDNLLFRLKKNGELINTTYSTLEELAEKELNGYIKNSIETFTIVWCWKYETGENLEIITIEDEKDTFAGSGKIAGKENLFDYSFSLKVIGTKKPKLQIKK